MSKVRITKIVCVVCKGTGSVLCHPCCYGCEGTGRLPVEQALQLADRRQRLARAGLIAGDYPANVARRLTVEATQIYAIAGRAPPWPEGSI